MLTALGMTSHSTHFR